MAKKATKKDEQKQADSFDESKQKQPVEIEKILVVFTKSYPPYMAGETAAFTSNTADQFVESEIAEYKNPADAPEKQETPEPSTAPEDKPVSELNLDESIKKKLTTAGLNTVGQVVAKAKANGLGNAGLDDAEDLAVSEAVKEAI